MKPNAFVAMPFGVKPMASGELVDFDRVFEQLLKPALEDAGCEVFRADQEQRAGDIRTDMFQQLLMADLVVADLTIDNPNVWYELGVRHALRARGVVLVQGPRAAKPFDVYTERKLTYQIAEGGPGGGSLARDRKAIKDMVLETLQASTRRNVSPVYALLRHLREPEWKSLLIEDDNEFSSPYNDWCRRIAVARNKRRPGDILVLANETPTRPLRIEALREAGTALRKLNQHRFALEQFDAALTIYPDDRAALQERAICLGRLGRHEDAYEAASALAKDFPGDAEVLALVGRSEKDRWIGRWCKKDAAYEQMKIDAAAEISLLEQAIEPYRDAFVRDPSHIYSGINALTLSLLFQHLGGELGTSEVDKLAGGVTWAVLAAQTRNPKDYWACASNAELCLLKGEPVLAGFQRAVAAARGDWFALDSTRQTLEILRNLQFRSEATATALRILDAEIQRLKPPAPQRVFLFSGHMIDEPLRDPPRFPMEKAKVDAAARAIEAALDKYGAAPGDLALTQGAAGADILFAEACLARGLLLRLHLPFDEPRFVDESIMAREGGAEWRDRWNILKDHAMLREMPDELGPTPRGVDSYERCNQWLLFSALAEGRDKVRFICFWNGGGSDGPGGTRHMYEEVKERTGHVTWIDSRKV